MIKGGPTDNQHVYFIQRGVVQVIVELDVDKDVVHEAQHSVQLQQTQETELVSGKHYEQKHPITAKSVFVNSLLLGIDYTMVMVMVMVMAMVLIYQL